ncbi:hypothetical protein GCM10020360_18740 [Nonlabens tegetincola]
MAAGALVTIAVAGSYVAAAALVPLPEPTLRLDVPAEQRFAVDDAAAQAAVDGQTLPTAVGWLDGDTVWANDDDAHPLASLTKLVTVLVGQEVEPLAPGEDGPSYTWTEADVEFQAELAEVDGIAFPIPAGIEVTRRELLTLALVPSANDFATAYAHSVFGDTDAFVAAAADWADREGLESLTVTEPSGIDDGNVASAPDVLQLARRVLEDPALAEIVAMEHATLPWGIGEVANTNPLLGESADAIGVKTGHTELAGYSLAAAAQGEFADRPLVRIAVVLGRDSVEARSDDALALLDSLAAMPERRAVVSSGEHLGTLTSIDGSRVTLSAAESFDAVLVPGESLTLSVEAGGDALAVTGPDGAQTLAVRRGGSFAEPSLGWRLTHPRELFGL